MCNLHSMTENSTYTELLFKIIFYKYFFFNYKLLGNIDFARV